MKVKSCLQSASLILGVFCFTHVAMADTETESFHKRLEFIKTPHMPITVKNNKGTEVTYLLKNHALKSYYIYPELHSHSHDPIAALDVIPSQDRNSCEYNPIKKAFSIDARGICTLHLLVRGQSDGKGKGTIKIKYGEHGVLSDKLEYLVKLPQWQTTDGPEGGTITDMILPTRKFNAFYASTRSAGIFKSEDKGKTWHAANKGLASNSTILSLEENIQGTLFAGSQENGVYKSTNHGKSWQSANGQGTRKLPANAQIDTMLLSNPGLGIEKLYADTSGQGLYVSTDAGQHWDNISGTLGNTLPAGASLPSLLVDNHTLYAGTNASGVYKSTDGGNTWKAANGTNCGVNACIPNNGNIVSLIKVGNAIYAAADRVSIYKTIDGGNNWISVKQNLQDIQTYNTTLAATAQGDIYLGTRFGVFTSIDPQVNGWTEITNDLVNKYIIDIDVSANGKNIYVSNNGGGIFKLLTAKSEWESLNKGIVASSIQTSLSVAPNGEWVAGSAGGGISSLSLGSADGWVQVNDNLLNLDIRGIVTTPNYWYAGTNAGGNYNRGGVFRLNTQTSPLFWDDYSAGLKTTYENIRAVAIAPNKDLFAGSSNGIYRRDTLNSSPWELLNLTKSVLSIATARNGNIYAGTDGFSVYASDDNGDTFVSIPFDSDPALNCLPSTAITRAVAVAPNGDLYAGIENDSTGHFGVYKFTPNGPCLQAANQGLPQDSFVYSLAIAATGFRTYDLYAGTNLGVYKSVDNGASWSAFNTNLNFLAIRSLAIAYVPQDYIVLAGTNGQGVFANGAYY